MGLLAVSDGDGSLCRTREAKEVFRVKASDYGGIVEPARISSTYSIGRFVAFSASTQPPLLWLELYEMFTNKMEFTDLNSRSDTTERFMC